MAIAAPVNKDVPSSWLIPGTYIQLDLTGSGAGLNNVQKRVLLVGYKTASGTAPQDTPIQAVGQAQANLYAGRGSDLARKYAAFQAQAGAGAADVFLLPIVAPSGGTAATQIITVVFSSGSTAAAADFLDLWICGYHVNVPVALGDTGTIIAANINSAINAVLDIPVTSGVSGPQVTLTYNHKGVVGEDLPIIANVNNTTASFVQLSPGTLTYANSATGSGSATVTIGGTTYSAAITNGDNAGVIATAVNAAINGQGGPVTSSISSTIVTLLYATDRVVRRVSAAIVTTTVTTVTLGTNGTVGAGTPTLTNALAVVAAQNAFPYWVTSFNDVTSLGTLSAHIELYANGLYQKGQNLWAASTAAIATAGAVPVGTSPLLTASTRYHFGWAVDSPQQAYEFAARHAAIVCAQDFKPYNYDGTPFLTSGTVPLLVTHRSSRPSPATLNSAIASYCMSPYAVDESTGRMAIVFSRTTSSDSDARKWDTGLTQTADFVRYDMGIFLRTRFKNKSIKSVGVPHTPNTITVDSIIDAEVERILQYEDADFYDGADQLRAAVKANINVLSPSRIDSGIPFRVPVPLHTLAAVLGLV